jgi:hypothetical protein
MNYGTCFLCEAKASIDVPRLATPDARSNMVVTCERCGDYFIRGGGYLDKVKALPLPAKQWLSRRIRRHSEEDPDEPFIVNEDAILLALRKGHE